MARSKKKAALKSTDELSNFANGKMENPDLERVRELEEKIGIKISNPLGTNDPKVFEKTLADSNLSDLQRLCEKVGIFPNSDKNRLKDQLRKEFTHRTKGQRTVSLQQDFDFTHPDHPDHEKAKKIFGL